MAGQGSDTGSGGKLALGILLLWFGGFLLFVAFMSGKVASLTAHVDQNGKPVGPLDMSELASRLADNVQAAGSSDKITKKGSEGAG